MEHWDTNIAIIGAGPYGLSLGAYLHHLGVEHRIFGHAMQSWRQNMPTGMCLKSDGFASTLYDPGKKFTLERFCKENGLPYQYSGMPIPLDTFVDYGMAFQKAMVPQLETVDVEHLEQKGTGFLLRTAAGETLTAKTVVLAVGIKHFGYVPEAFQGLPSWAISHSYQYGDMSHLRGKKILVVGAGASAIDLAAALADHDVDVHLMGRRPKIGFHVPEMDPRPLRRRIFYPRSGLGIGWEYVICVDAPLLFRALPERFRHRVVRRHLGPVPGWFMKEKIENRIPMHLSARIEGVSVEDDRVHVRYSQPDRPGQEFVADHVIAATGYKPHVKKLPFVDPALLAKVRTVDETPVLSPTFQTSVKNLHMIGLASANCFGPAHRFAVGAKWTSRALSRHLKSSYA